MVLPYACLLLLGDTLLPSKQTWITDRRPGRCHKATKYGHDKSSFPKIDERRFERTLRHTWPHLSHETTWLAMAETSYQGWLPLGTHQKHNAQQYAHTQFHRLAPSTNVHIFLLPKTIASFIRSPTRLASSIPSRVVRIYGRFPTPTWQQAVVEDPMRPQARSRL